MRLLLVPGFTQTRTSWDGVRAGLDASVDVVALDVPHASSFAATAHALGDEGGHGVWCGYSMGGRLALRLALDRPDLVERLVLVSATPGIADAAERVARVASDERLARDIDHGGTAAFLEQWLAQPMFADVPPDAPGIADRAVHTADDLTHALHVLGTGAMEPMWDRLGELAMPVLVVSGDADSKFSAIGDDMAARIPGAERARVGCGHAVPLAQPQALAALLHDFTKPPASSSATTT